LKTLFLILFLIFAGCANKEYIFVPTTAKCIKKTHIPIGVEQVTLPYYMEDLEIMKLKNMQLIPTNKFLSKTPTQIIVTKLSNELCDSNVFMYPWGKKPKYKIEVKIDDLYFQNHNIVLSARIYINSKFLKIHIYKQCKNEYNCINEAFNVIVNKIIKEIK